MTASFWGWLWTGRESATENDQEDDVRVFLSKLRQIFLTFLQDLAGYFAEVRSPPEYQDKIVAVESISYLDTPPTLKKAIIRVKISRIDAPTQIKCLTYDQIHEMEGGKETLAKYGPVFNYET
jgi:hypothetical protein